MTRFLPEDVLGEQILRRLAPRDLAVSRCVCAEWKVAVDGRRLLRRDLLPLSVGGIFLNIDAQRYTELFRPSSSSSSSYSGDFTHLLDNPDTVVGHCNGLVLFYGCVVANPATGWFAPIPPRPTWNPHQVAHLVFDPAVSSSHYSVFLVNYATLYDDRNKINAAAAAATEEEEWPPCHYPLHVFSSATGRWEERPFLRQGDAAGPIAAVRPGKRVDGSVDRCFAAYWKQALYVHCRNNFFFRISLSRDEYRVIKPPPGITVHSDGLVFGKSEKGPYLAESRYYADCCFKVWILDDHHQWVLRHCNKHLGMMLPRCYLDNKVRPAGPWVLEDINYKDDLKYWDEETARLGLMEITTRETAAAKQQQPPHFDEDAGGFTLDSTSPDEANDDGRSCYVHYFEASFIPDLDSAESKVIGLLHSFLDSLRFI
ncbi:unnamed protein product [Urochloa decumbens]|uniref:F-box domain-containing protein n=1 Tax=Urochloa decumbens TaxID=240449 RepID=A0ABC8Y6D1_9POAL